MATACRALSEDIVRLQPEEPEAFLYRWQPSPDVLNAPPSIHNLLYQPNITSDHEGAAARAFLHATQFPTNKTACDRILLLEDDLVRAGLGYTSGLLVKALLIAVQEKRVLMPLPSTNNRWCSRPPNTLNCVYEPWTHCPMPLSAKKRARRWNAKDVERQMPVRLISTTQIHHSRRYGLYASSLMSDQLRAAAFEVLFRPRQWVRNAAHCTMRQFDLRSGSFIVMHVRFSPEKREERPYGIPPLRDYFSVAKSAVRKHNVSTLFLQTSSPLGLDLLTSWCNQSGTRLAYTENVRAEHDIWMANTSGERAAVAAQAVNAYIASQSTVFISPAVSMWTYFVEGLMHRPHQHVFAHVTEIVTQHKKILVEVVASSRHPSSQRQPSNTESAREAQRPRS